MSVLFVSETEAQTSFDGQRSVGEDWRKKSKIYSLGTGRHSSRESIL